jgi:tetraether lipid synthase
VHGPEHEWGQLSCGCHPNCGVGLAVMIDKHTKEAVPVSAFLNAERLAADVRQVTDAGRGRVLSLAGLALAVMRNYEPFRAPRHLTVAALIRKFARKLAGGKPIDREAQIAQRRGDRWNFLFIAGMWFQDLFNYDFRRTEMCIIPYATQHGEISFCAYNTGVGWRSIVEKMHMTATLAKWYEAHGRHQIYAGGRAVDLPASGHTLVLDPEAVAAGRQTDLDEIGVARNAREEKRRARRNVPNATPDDERMAALYRQHVLKEPPPEPVIRITGLGREKRPS